MGKKNENVIFDSCSDAYNTYMHETATSTPSHRTGVCTNAIETIKRHGTTKIYTSCQNTKQKPDLTSAPTPAKTPELQTPNNITEHQVTKHKPVTPNTKHHENTKTPTHQRHTITFQQPNHKNIKVTIPSKPQNHQEHQNLQTISNPTITPCNTPRGEIPSRFSPKRVQSAKKPNFRADFLHNRPNDECAYVVWRHLNEEVLFPKSPCSCLLRSPVVCRDNHRLPKLRTARISGCVYLADVRETTDIHQTSRNNKPPNTKNPPITKITNHHIPKTTKSLKQQTTKTTVNPLKPPSRQKH